MLGQRKKYYKGLIHQNQIQGSSYDQLQIENIRNTARQYNIENGHRKAFINDKLIDSPITLNVNTDFDSCLEILSKTNRTVKEILLLANYLEQFQFVSKFFLSSEEKKEELLILMSCSLKHEFTQKSRIVFRYGDKSCKYYIILRGSVSIIRPKPIRFELSEDDFINYLIILRKYKETEILLSVINENRNLFFFEDDFELWLKSSNKNDYQKGKFFQKIMNNTRITEAILLCEEQLKFSKKIEEEEEEEEDVNCKDYIERINITNLIFPSEKEKKSYLIYQYDMIIEHGSGSKFGDFALGNSSKRTATVLTNLDTDFATMDKLSFDITLKEIKMKEMKEMVDFFLSTNIFFHFSRKIFEHKMIPLFVIKNVYKNEKLYLQGDQIKRIFFIKKGEFELYARSSLVEFQDYYDYFGNTKKVSLLESHLEQEMIQNNPKFKKYINNKMLIKLSIAKNGDVIGLNDMLFNKQSIFTVECSSAFGEVYYIDKTAFAVLLENYKDLSINCSKFEESKIKYLLERFKIIKESKLKMFNTQNKEDFKERRKFSNNCDDKMIIPDKKRKNFSLDYYKNIKFHKNILNINFNVKFKNKNTEAKDANGELHRNQNYINSLSPEKKNDNLRKEKITNKLSPLKTNLLSPIKKNITKTPSAKEETNLSETDYQNSFNLINFNKQTSKKVSATNNQNKSQLKSALTKRNIFEIKKQDDNKHYNKNKDIAFMLFENLYKNKVDNRKHYHNRNSLHIIDVLNEFDNYKNNDKNEKLVLSNSCSNFFLTSKIEKKLAPAKNIKKKQTASKTIRYKINSSMKIEEQLFNQGKILKIKK